MLSENVHFEIQHQPIYFPKLLKKHCSIQIVKKIYLKPLKTMCGLRNHVSKHKKWIVEKKGWLVERLFEENCCSWALCVFN